MTDRFPPELIKPLFRIRLKWYLSIQILLFLVSIGLTITTLRETLNPNTDSKLSVHSLRIANLFFTLAVNIVPGYVFGTKLPRLSINEQENLRTVLRLKIATHLAKLMPAILVFIQLIGELFDQYYHRNDLNPRQHLDAL